MVSAQRLAISFIFIRIIIELTINFLMMMKMMMIIIFMVWLTGERRLALFPDHCQKYSPSRISDTPQAVFEPEQSLCSGFAE